MINTNLLKGKIVAKGFTQQQLAEKMNISLNSLSAKINGKKAFTLPEVDKLCEVVEITDAKEKCEIFLPGKSHIWDN